MPSLVGSNWGGLLFTAVIFLVTEAVLWKWGDIKSRWGRSALIGFAVALIGWMLLFGVSAFLILYDDHRNLVGATARIKRTLRMDRDNSHRELLSNRLDCAKQQGENETLQKQNRDQQSSINGCLTQAMKLLTPESQETSILYMDGLQPANTPAGVQGSVFLLMTNKIVTPFRMDIARDSPLTDLQVIPLSTGGTRMGGAARSAETAFSVNIGSPAWTPTAPFLAEIYHKTKAVRCNFIDR